MHPHKKRKQIKTMQKLKITVFKLQHLKSRKGKLHSTSTLKHQIIEQIREKDLDTTIHHK